MFNMMSVFSKTVPLSVQNETAWELKTITTMHGMKWRMKLQGLLMVVTAISSLFLLGYLGVEGDGNMLILFVGAAGATAIVTTLVIGSFALVRTLKQKQRRNSTILRKSYSSRFGKSMEVGDIKDQMVIATVI